MAIGQGQGCGWSGSKADISQHCQHCELFLHRESEFFTIFVVDQVATKNLSGIASCLWQDLVGGGDNEDDEDNVW